MTTPRADPVDVEEQRHPVVEEPPLPDGELDDDTPEADAAEQRMEVAVDDEDAPIG